MTGRHQGPPHPDDIAALTGDHHVGRGYPGMFPHLELACPCPKARCGLVAPVKDIPCEHHHTGQLMRQVHDATTCPRRFR